MKNKRKPNLAGIQEFGVAAYVKDLKAGKLDAQAKKGRFVGYDSESKKYRIYWPEKRSVTVERNVIFNQDDAHTSDDTAIIYGEAQSEGEKDKVIQALQNNNEDLEKSKDEEPKDQQTSEEELQPHQVRRTLILFRFHQLMNHNPNSTQNNQTIIHPRVNNMVMDIERSTKRVTTKP
jgi:hypothetical protein